MKTFLMLIGLLGAAMAYVCVNALVVNWLIRHLPSIGRLVYVKTKRFVRIESRAISSTRIWSTVATHLLSVPLFLYAVVQPHSLLKLTTLIFGFVLLVSAVTLSLIRSLPTAHKLWEDAATKIAVITVPTYLLFVARGYAGVWVGDTIGMSAINASSAFLATTALLLSLALAIALLGATLIFELAFIASMLRSTKSMAKVRLQVLCGTSFFALIAAVTTVTQLPSSALGNRLIAAIIFEFDAAPANHCALTNMERLLVERDEPFIKALYLSTAQDHAILFKRGPDLFRPVVLRDLKSSDVKVLLEPIRVVECFKVPALTQ